MQTPRLHGLKLGLYISLALAMLLTACSGGSDESNPRETGRYATYELRAGRNEKGIKLPDSRRLYYRGDIADIITTTFNAEHPEYVGNKTIMYPFYIVDANDRVDSHKYQIGGGTVFPDFTIQIMSVTGTNTPSFEDDVALVKILQEDKK